MLGMCQALLDFPLIRLLLQGQSLLELADQEVEGVEEARWPVP